MLIVNSLNNRDMPEKKTGKWVFIVNPVAGNGFALSIIPRIEEMTSKFGVDAEIAITQSSGHAEEISADFSHRGYRFIIAVGGDGTFNEVARPLINNKNVISGIIPAGTGNDFNQITGFPDRFSTEDWEIFFRCNTVEMDAGVCNGKFFMNGMGLGFDAQVAAENYTEPGKVKRGGKQKYIWHILKTLLFFREKSMQVFSTGEKEVTDCFINTVANGRRFAGGFYLTPKAIADDGLLDVCMIKKLGLLYRLKLLMKVPKGEHIYDKKVNYFQTQKLLLEFNSEVPYHLDGELFFASRFDISVLHPALKIIYNPAGKHYFSCNQDKRIT